VRESRGGKPRGVMKLKGRLPALGGIPSLGGGRTTGPSRTRWVEAERERTRWDPKDGELCLSRLKPEETLVEGRSDSDVQIDRQT
jgi:hypothetical protein